MVVCLVACAATSAGVAAPSYAADPLPGAPIEATKRVGQVVAKAASNAEREIKRPAQDVEQPVRVPKSSLVETLNGQQPPNPFRITIGRYFSDSRSISRGAGSLGSLGFDYDTRVNNLLGGATIISLYADLNTGGRYSRNNSAEFDADIIGLGVSARRVFTRDLNKGHFYAGAGVGIYATRYTIDPLGPERYRKTDYSPGLRLIGGYQFDKNYFLQFDLLALDSFRTRNSNGASVRVNPSGARFGFGYRF